MRGLTITSYKLQDGRGYETRIRADDPAKVDHFIKHTSGEVMHLADDGKSAVIVSRIGWKFTEAGQ